MDKKTLVEAIYNYVIDTLKNPANPGNEVGLVPELVRIMNSLSCFQFQRDDS